MTREEAIKRLESIKETYETFAHGLDDIHLDIEALEYAVNMTTKVLEQEPNKWISVSERLPEDGEAVITINEDKDYAINHVIDEDNGEWFYNGAIAWMPLPKPYKAESEE